MTRLITRTPWGKCSHHPTRTDNELMMELIEEHGPGIDYTDCVSTFPQRTKKAVAQHLNRFYMALDPTGKWFGSDRLTAYKGITVLRDVAKGYGYVFAPLVVTDDTFITGPIHEKARVYGKIARGDDKPGNAYSYTFNLLKSLPPAKAVGKVTNPVTIARINWKANFAVLSSVLTIPQMISSINHYRMFRLGLPPVALKTLKRYLSGGKDYTDKNVSYVENWAEFLRLFALGKIKAY